MRNIIEVSDFTATVSIPENGDPVAAETRDPALQAIANRTRFLKDRVAPDSVTVSIDLAAPSSPLSGWTRSSIDQPYAATSPGDRIYFPLAIPPGASLREIQVRVWQDLSTGPGSIGVATVDIDGTRVTVASHAFDPTPGWSLQTWVLGTPYVPTLSPHIFIVAGSVGDQLSGGNKTYGF